MQVRKAMAKYIDDNILDVDLSALAQAKAYREFVKKNKDVLKSVYGDDFNKIFVSPKNFERNFLKPMREYDQKIIQLQSVFGTDANSLNPVFDIVGEIIRSTSAVKETGLLRTRIKFLMETVGDDPVLKEQIKNLTKTFITKDMLKLKRGGSGLWEIEPNALNKILNEGLGPENVLGPRVTFEEVYKDLLGGGKEASEYIGNLKLLNNIIMREQGVAPSGAARKALSEKTLAFPGARFIFRMLIPPLTQKGRRATALNNALNARAGDFMGELIANPKLLDQTIKYTEGKMTAQKYISILSSYSIVSLNDLGNELDHYDEVYKKMNNKKPMTDEIQTTIDDMMNSYRQHLYNPEDYPINRGTE